MCASVNCGPLSSPRQHRYLEDEQPPSVLEVRTEHSYVPLCLWCHPNGPIYRNVNSSMIDLIQGSRCLRLVSDSAHRKKVWNQVHSSRSANMSWDGNSCVHYERSCIQRIREGGLGIKTATALRFALILGQSLATRSSLQ